MIPFLFNENQFSFFFFFFCYRPSTSWPVVYKSQERLEPSIMLESDTMFNERDRRCAAVQLMLSTDPTYDNGTFASTLQMQIWIATNNRPCPVWWIQSFRLQLRSLVWFHVRTTSCHLTSSKSAWKSTPKCIWMCWRVWWSPGSKRRRLGFRRSATTLYPSYTGPLLPRPESAGLLRLVIRREHHQYDLPQHQSQPDRLHPPSIRRAPAGACGKPCSQFQIHIETVIGTEGGGYIEEMSALLHNQVTWIDCFNKSFKIKL